MLAEAKFTNESCEADGVKPTDPLLFICKIYEAFLLRVQIPSNEIPQEIISFGDGVEDITLPTGFTAVSVDIAKIDMFTSNFSLTISIDRASRLEGGNITCDDTTTRKRAIAGCEISKL